jgi:hypothetical protein
VWQAVARQSVYALIVVGGSLAGSRYGLEGIAFAVLGALAWQFWALTNLAFRQVGGTWSGLGAALLPVIIASAASALVGGVADYVTDPSYGVWIRLLVIGIATAVPYFATLWMFRQTPQVAQLVRLSSELLPQRRQPLPFTRKG